MALQDLTPQLRTRLRKVEWLVGLFLGLTALLMLAAFGYFVKRTADARGWFVVEAPYYTYLSDGSGLRPGTPVNMMGFKIGEVRSVTALSVDDRLYNPYYSENNYNVFVAFAVREPYPGYIGTDSRVRVGGYPVDLLGGTTLEITPGTQNGVPTYRRGEGGRPEILWEKYAYVAGRERTNFLRYGPLTNGTKGYFVAREAGGAMLLEVQEILRNVRESTATLNAALPAFTNAVLPTLATLRDALPGLTNELQQVLLTARQTLPGLTNNLDAVLANTRELTANLRDSWPMLTNNLDQTLLATRLLASHVTGVIPTLSSNLNLTLTNVNVLLTRDTNITAYTSQLMSNVNQVLTRHWLFRSAFKPKAPPRETRAAGRPPRP